MGAPKQKWTSEEEEALRAGVAKHGTGKWKNIQKDPEFGHCLAARSNIDLKDKWRNMSVSASGQGSREKFKAPKLKALPPIPSSNTQTPSSVSVSVPLLLPLPHDDDKRTDSSKSPADAKVAPRYNPVIFEALSTMKEPNGSDINSIMGFIEQRNEVPPNFRRLLSTKLRRLVQQDKLEKIQNCYKIKRDVASGQKASSIQKQKDDHHQKQLKAPAVKTLADEIQEAAINAAYMLADAENKAFMASEAVKEAERVAKMAEDSNSVLQLAKEIFEQCSRGEIVLMA